MAYAVIAQADAAMANAASWLRARAIAAVEVKTMDPVDPLQLADAGSELAILEHVDAIALVERLGTHAA